MTRLMAYGAHQLDLPLISCGAVGASRLDGKMRQSELIETMIDAFGELAALHNAAAAIAERALSALTDYRKIVERDETCRKFQCQQIPSDRPMVNPSTFTVVWQGRHCHLGPSILFKLIERLSRQPDRFYPYDILLDEVWDGLRSNTAIRSAVKRLRRALCEAGMVDLAGAIKGRGKCYGLFLNGTDP
jgi:DNA-binding response OmpR family regulator